MKLNNWFWAYCLRGVFLYHTWMTADYCDRPVLWTWERMLKQTGYYVGQDANVRFSRN